MRCPECDAEIKPGMNQCPNCGAKLPQIVKCPGCGKYVFETWNYCPFCRKELNEKKSSKNEISCLGNNDNKKNDKGTLDKPAYMEKWKQLYNFAHSINGLNYLNVEKAKAWADEKIEFFENHDFEQWKQLYNFAHSINGLNYLNVEEAKAWADEKIKKIDKA